MCCSTIHREHIHVFPVLQLLQERVKMIRYIYIYIYKLFTYVGGAALLVGRSGDRFQVVSLWIFSVEPLTEPCALRSTQPLEVSTRDLSWGKGGRCVRLTTYHPCSAESQDNPGP